jgi:hypothetical protein
VIRELLDLDLWHRPVQPVRCLGSVAQEPLRDLREGIGRLQDQQPFPGRLCSAVVFWLRMKVDIPRKVRCVK